MSIDLDLRSGPLPRLHTRTRSTLRESKRQRNCLSIECGTATGRGSAPKKTARGAAPARRSGSRAARSRPAAAGLQTHRTCPAVVGRSLCVAGPRAVRTSRQGQASSPSAGQGTGARGTLRSPAPQQRRALTALPLRPACAPRAPLAAWFLQGPAHPHIVGA